MKKRGHQSEARKGAIIILAAIMLVFVLLVMAFVVDLGYVTVARTEVQRAADAAAHAAALEYRRSGDTDAAISAARTIAADYSGDNEVTAEGSLVDANVGNAVNGDIVVGRYDFSNGDMTFGETSGYNAVEVRIRRDAEINGKVPLFFAGITGIDSLPVVGKARAALVKDVKGFTTPSSGQNVPFLPITVQVDYWYDQIAKANDDFEWDAVTQTASNGNDGVAEVNIYPDKKTNGGNGNGNGNGNSGGSTDGAGNFGTVNVGTDNNSTAHLGDIIRNGVTQEQLDDFHEGSLELKNGKLILGGDPGISAGIKDDLEAVIGQPVALPLYKKLTGNGNNAQYEIVKFVGIRIVDVELTGGDKALMVQPATLSFPGVIPEDANDDGSEVDSSDDVFSPVSIVF